MKFRGTHLGRLLGATVLVALVVGTHLLTKWAFHPPVAHQGLARPGLNATKDTLYFEQEGDEPECSAEFAISNGGNNSATITRIASSCDCTTPKNLVGTVLGPGQSVILPVTVRYPTGGKRRTDILVHVDNQPLPLALHVEVTSRSNVPYIKLVENGDLYFDSDSDFTEPFRITVETIEAKNSPNWIECLTTDLEELILEPAEMQEQSGYNKSIVRRIYGFEARWVRAPAGPNFGAVILAVTSTGGRSSMRIGSVAGFLDPPRAILPSVILCNDERDCVEQIFVREGSGVWRVDPHDPIPDWISVSSAFEHGQQVFHLTVHKDHINMSSFYTLRFSNESGKTNRVEVISVE